MDIAIPLCGALLLYLYIRYFGKLPQKVEKLMNGAKSVESMRFSKLFLFQENNQGKATTTVRIA